MGKKLLFLVLIQIAYLLPTTVLAQCPSSVSISATHVDKDGATVTGTNICFGTEVKFTATPNGGSGYLYQWQKGGVDIGGASNASYTSTDLSNGDEIRVIIKSSAASSTCSTTSSVITMTVNPVLTPSVSISASKTTICPGDNITFTANPVNGGTNASYVWKVNGSNVQTGASNTYSTNALTNNQSVTVSLTSNATCASTTPVTSSPIPITVKSGTPGKPGNITGPIDPYPGISGITYSVASVANATEYIWSLPNGWSGSSTTNSITVTSGATGTGTISVQAKNDCGTSAASNPLPVNVKAGTPAQPGTISGTAAVCPGVSTTYTVPNVTGVTYTWTYPSGWSGSSTTNSITLIPGSAGQNGQITVTAKNSCGTSPSTSLTVSVKNGTPATPTTLSGAAAVCPSLSETYSIPAVAGATQYIWTLPTGFSASNLTTTSPSIIVTAGASGSGNITVKAQNDCGTSAAAIISVSISNPAPVMSGSITQPTNGVCANTTGHIYSIPAITNATSYVWTIPSGWNITGGAGTRSITVSSGGTGGTISVLAKNSCGESSANPINVVLNNPPPIMTGEISGAPNVCASTAGNVFSIPAITNATGYVWTVPTGWNILAGATTNSITVTSGTTGGSISVRATNSCGTSASKSFAVTTTNGKPQQPGVISTNLSAGAICPPATGITFEVTAVAGVTYKWTLPNGFEITNGANTNKITVKVNANVSYPASEKVEVEAVNVCGSSSKRIYEPISISDKFVTVDAGPDQTVCRGVVNLVGKYSFGNGNANLQPVWSVTPAGAGTFAAPTSEVTTFTPTTSFLNSNPTNAQVTLRLTTTKQPNGACVRPDAPYDEVIINFRDKLAATITATSPVCSGNTSNITFTGNPNTQITYRVGSGSNQTVQINASGTATISTNALTANTTTYNLVNIQYNDVPSCLLTVTGSATITTTPKPTVSLSYSGTPFCTSINTLQPASLQGTNAYTGGKYSSTTGLIIDENSGAITPSSSTPGTYTVTYITKEEGGCAPITATTQVTITKAPTAAISYTGSPFCGANTSEIPVNLSGTDLYLDGVFSAPAGLSINATTGKITPILSTPGEYIVKYETPSTNGCAKVSTTTTIVIDAAPTVTISYADSPVCKSNTNGNAVTITGTGDYLGGVFSAPSGLTINASSGSINASTSTPGTYTVSYKTSSVKCQEVEATTDVTITEIPSVEISYNTPSCNNAGVISVTFANGIGAFEGGTFSATPGGLTIDSASGEINTNTSSPGNYIVKYLINGTGGCSDVEITTNITITQLPQVSISYPEEICSSETSVLVNLTVNAGAGSDGVFSGTAGLDISDDGTINPSTSTTGSHTVEYTIVSESGCDEVIATADLIIKKVPFISTDPVNTGTCSNSPAQFEVVASGDDLVYQWYRIVDDIPQILAGEDEAVLSFSNVTSADAGKYYVVVSGADSCSEDTSVPATLNVDEDIIITEPLEDITICEDQEEFVEFTFRGNAGGAALTFKWMKDGQEVIEDEGKIDFINSESAGEYTGILKITDPEPGAAGDSGVYYVVVKGPDYFTCPEGTSKTFTFRVEPSPGAPSVSNEEYCLNETAGNLTAAGEDGNEIRWYTYDESTTEYTYIGNNIAIDTSEPNTFIYYATQTKTNGCESDFSEPLTIRVLDKPDLVSAEAIKFEFCHNEEVSEALSVSPTDDATLNWYDVSEGGTALSSAPTPVTSEVKVTSYWISQTLTSTGCESDRTEVKIIINALPNLSITVANSGSQNICLGSEINFVASGATNYTWTLNENEVGTSATLTHVPTNTGVNTYILTGVGENGCINTTEITINVDEQSLAGIINAPERICISNPSATVVLESKLGAITKWEYKNLSTGDVWTATSEADLTDSRTFTGIDETTSYRVTVKNGVCDEVTSEATIIVDQLPVGGNLTWSNNERIFLTCEVQTNNFDEVLKLQDYVGEIIEWEYRTASTLTWTKYNSQSSSLTNSDFASLLGTNVESTVFRAKLANGACANGTYSQTAILSVIPSDIKPSPVEASPDVLCYGNEISLSSSTGYGQEYGQFEGGDFTSAGIKNNGWNFTDTNGNEIPYDANANNGNPIHWHKTQPKWKFITANIDPPYNTTERWWNPRNDGKQNEHFAIAQSTYSSNMDTPPFTLNAIDEGIVTFDQAFNLTTGASIRVILLKNGVEYKELYKIVGPASSGNYDRFGYGTKDVNQMQLDLGSYIGESNLRLRFEYRGVRLGDIWAVDNIKVPDGPQDVLLQWFYDDDASDPSNTLEQIGVDNQENVSFIPRKIGWNDFEVKTALILDSNGDPCEDINNSETIRVFVFDQYTTTITAETGECGNTRATLHASTEAAFQGTIDEYPTIDGYVGSWVITGPNTDFILSNQDDSSTLDPINNPDAIFEATELGNYSFSWKLTPTAVYPDNFYDESLRGQPVVNTNCPPIININEVELPQCTTLDYDGLNDYVSIQDVFAEAKTVEMWIYPEGDTGTIISGPGLEIKMSDLTAYVTPNSRWYHIALLGNKLYIDGIDSGASINATGTGNQTLIGAKWNNSTQVAENYFSGWIEEVRIWKSSVSIKEIRFMMNQRLDLNSKASGDVQGEVVPNKTVPGSYNTSGGFNLDQDGDAFYNQKWNDLIGYYRLISEIPDPTLNLITNTHKPVNGYTPDLSLTPIDGRLHNMTTHQQNTSPTPYVSGANGNWETDGNTTWLRPLVWDDPNSNGINSTPIEWNIARIKHDIQSGKKDIIMLGLISETGKLNIMDPGSTGDETNKGQLLRVTHYLKLDGNVDLVGESQLLQDQGSILAEASNGWLERDQQGQANSFIYNYWSSPVSKTGDQTNNTPYSILDVMKYGTNSNSPTNFNLVNGPFSADDAALNSSTYWFWRFHGLADDYDSWIYIGDDLGGKKLNTGEAHTMKGVNGGMSKDATQNYVYKGKPHNGDITLTINPNENYLVGNPYPSALNGREFILDNIAYGEGRNSKNNFNGTIYFWDHFETTNHNLREYIGGYAVLNLIGGTPAASIDERIDNSNPYSGRSNQKIPNHYIPIGQGFFISTVHDAISNTSINIVGGDFIFKNSQRIYKRENGTDNSIFLRPEIPVKPSKEALTNKEEDKFEKIRLSFLSPKGYNRQILVGAHPATTNGFDMGYDAPMIDYNVEDMYWLQGGEFLVIQGVPDFGKDQVLPIGIRIDEEGEFKIKIDTLENMRDDHSIYLKDIVLDSIHDLRAGPYTSKAEPGEITNRLQLIFYKEQTTPDPIVVEEPIIDDFSEISLTHSYLANEMMVLNPRKLEISVIHLFDLNGKLLEIYDEVPSEAEIRLKVSNYSEGIYILKMHTDKDIITRKIIIKK